MRDEKMVTSMASKVMVCVTSYSEGEIQGTIYNDYYEKKISFISTTELINGLESLYNSLSFPQKFMETRSFGVKRLVKRAKKNKEIDKIYEEIACEEGIANFSIHVKFRMNADWQGEICWLEKGIRQNFNSTLEMIKLMDSALNQ
ncbi:MAG: hypothetical protein E7261_06700 [Lachnospiraceae bacterium]|nr:hypothetical protein [Lachnospiraceae bacterium]